MGGLTGVFLCSIENSTDFFHFRRLTPGCFLEALPFRMLIFSLELLDLLDVADNFFPLRVELVRFLPTLSGARAQ